jgi:hypothetical protein
MVMGYVVLVEGLDVLIQRDVATGFYEGICCLWEDLWLKGLLGLDSQSHD